MISKEFLTELDQYFVNDEIKKQRNGPKKIWKMKGQGVTASVWQRYDDPHTVVKVVGGGEYESFKHERGCTLAFVHFCVDHGWRSKHFPIVHGINIDDDEVLQVRIEKLVDPNDWICDSCAALARGVRYNSPPKEMKYRYDNLAEGIYTDPKYRGKNTAQGILEAIQILNQAIPAYKHAHDLPQIILDLHGGNWLARQDGTIVAADPWFCETTYGDRPGANSSGSSTGWSDTDQSGSGSF